MMEHSSVTLRWMGLGFHQLRGERGKNKQGGKGGGGGGKKGKIREKEVKT